MKITTKRFKDLKISTKMYLGFISAALMTLIVGTIGYRDISKITYQLEVSKIANRIIGNAGDAQTSSLNYIIYDDDKYYEQVKEKVSDITELSIRIKELLTQADNKEKSKEIIHYINHFMSDNINFHKIEQKKKVTNKKRMDAEIKVMNQIIKMIDAAKTYSRDHPEDYLAVEMVYVIQNARNAINRIRILSNKYLAKPSDEYAKGLNRELTSVFTLLKEAEKGMPSNKTKKVIKDVFISLNYYNEEFKTFMDLAKMQDSLLIDQRIDASNLLSNARDLRNGVYEYIDKKESKMTLELLIIILLTTAFGLLIGSLITRGITKPLAKGVAFADNISKGDLTQTLAIEQQDEIGRLALAMNNMSYKLREIVTEVMSTSESISVVNERIIKAVYQMSQKSYEQKVISADSLSIMNLAAKSTKMAKKSEDLKEIVDFFKIPSNKEHQKHQ